MPRRKGRSSDLYLCEKEMQCGSSGRSVQRIAARQEEAGGDRTEAPVPMEISRKRPPGLGTIRPILIGLL